MGKQVSLNINIKLKLEGFKRSERIDWIPLELSLEHVMRLNWKMAAFQRPHVEPKKICHLKVNFEKLCVLWRMVNHFSQEKKIFFFGIFEICEHLLHLGNLFEIVYSLGNVQDPRELWFMKRWRIPERIFYFKKNDESWARHFSLSFISVI